jgi:alpha-L-fucosidase
MKASALQLLCAISLAILLAGCTNNEPDIPYWLTDYSDNYEEDPIEASRQWFVDAKMGMFVHFNVASLMEHGSIDYKLWTQGNADERILDYVGISMEDYNAAESKEELLFSKFEYAEFDAEKICQLALKANMKYITFTAHHFAATFDSEHIPYTTVNSSPPKRDLVAEMVAACKKYNLAPFLYMGGSYKTLKSGTPETKLAILEEILTNYGPLAGLWFDGGQPGDDEVNEFIKKLQPQCLVSFKHGIESYTEDYISPEFFIFPFEYKMPTEGQQLRWEIRKKRWEKEEKESWEYTKYKLREVCNTMMEAKWRDGDTDQIGWMNSDKARRLSGEEAYFWLTYTRFTGSNLLMSIGPRKNGSIHPDAEKGLIELGKIIEERGWPPVVHEIPEKPE